MSTKREQITTKAIEALKASPNGIRYSDLVRKMQEEFPDTPVNTIHGTIWDLDARLPREVYKPARGLFRHSSFKEKELVEEKRVTPTVEEIDEDDFYQPFADWLVNDLEECSKAIPLGRDYFKDKWGTPDVIGILEPRKSDIIKPPTDIIAAEIKIDTAGLITAFGQACAYKCFAHKSYIVVPKESRKEDLDRLDALCNIFGIGLILFDSANAKAPGFEIRVRASKHEPDMFYVNKYMKIVEDKLFG
jgi:hypothetical protein